ncbi:MAG: hypothetical protein CVU29_06270 [Betaproteobacteria bacterium HGW-Betaproteobacteria-22]|nr:MAG: hypothetical protein CVU29_06270 [Betaproteobacteria bacterium HGW-Betaproteobacteria-22]
MTTMNLKQAAAYLHMHPVTLLLKAQSGKVPAAKPAKCWVFIQQDLQDFLRGLYRYSNKKPDNHPHQANAGISQGFSSKSAYYQLLGIADCPQIHSPQPDPRSGARHADEADQVAKGEAVGLVVKSVTMTQSKTRMM